MLGVSRPSGSRLLCGGSSASRRLAVRHGRAAFASTSRPTATHEIRESFQSYFESQQHTRLKSSGLIPINDPTLLFTNAGMVQFKDYFLGLEDSTKLLPHGRATTVQKCVRAGGKHNDLDNVGHTARHHTFFEMLGNFSFGDYGKEQAIFMAWEYLTKELQLPPDRLGVSVHHTDDESARIWERVTGWGSAAESAGRIVRLGDEDNFWSMGDTGPCGPCSEIFWDQQADVDGERMLEVWNLVFMEHQRLKDGTLVPLDRPCVDTGMGLERIASVMQGVSTNYDVDTMRCLADAVIGLVARRTGEHLTFRDGLDPAPHCTAIKVVADHLRSAAMMVADGVVPSNVGRGYVLRRIVRRAVRFGSTLGLKEPFLADLLPALLQSLGPAYPELIERRSVVEGLLRSEEDIFLATLHRGLRALQDDVFGRGALQADKVVPGDAAFQLYDACGFPLDLTQLIAEEKGWRVDTEGFAKCMELRKEESRAGSLQGSTSAQGLPPAVRAWQTAGIRPRSTALRGTHEPQAKVLAVHADPDEPSKGWMAIEPCPFYAEGGGQVGDIGHVQVPDGPLLNVESTISPYPGGVVLRVSAPGMEKGDTNPLACKQLLLLGRTVEAKVDTVARAGAAVHHTATHLLHSALHRTLGNEEGAVAQAGSLVTPDRLRFDFTWPKGLTAEQLQSVEDQVNDAALRELRVGAQYMGKEEAAKSGAMALFGEKYGDVVRVVDVPGMSAELCGGTHVDSTDECFPFKILSEASVAAGTRRIEALSGRAAVKYLMDSHARLEAVQEHLGCNRGAVTEKLRLQADKVTKAEKELAKLKRSLIGGAQGSAWEQHECSWLGVGVKLHVVPSAVASDMKLVRQKGTRLSKESPEIVHILLCEPAPPKEKKGQKKCKKEEISSGDVAGAKAPGSPAWPCLVFASPELHSEQGAAPGAFKQIVDNLTVHGGRGGGSPQLVQGQLPCCANAGSQSMPLEVLRAIQQATPSSQ